MEFHAIILVLIPLFFLLISFAGPADKLTLYAAGSLKAALGDVAASYKRTYHTEVTTEFGPSGLLRETIEQGKNPDVFASANMTHPEDLAFKGWGGPVVLFARNNLCLLAGAGVKANTDTLLDTLMNEKIRIGTSTPKADPSGDYAWLFFQKAEKIKKGSFAALSGKALQLTGGPYSKKAPEGRNQYEWIISENKADVFLTYCTNAVLARNEDPTLCIVRIDQDLCVGADYGLIVRKNAPREAWRLALYILSPAGQKLLGSYGFETTASQE